MTDVDPLVCPHRIMFAGDWHGNTRWAVNILSHCTTDVDVVIHTGDFGYDFKPSYLAAIDQAAPCPVLFVDGNHENHPALNAYPVGDDGLRRLSAKVWHIPRGFAWNWDGIRFMGVGGAFSVDRLHRILGESWWMEETLTDDDIEYAVSAGPVDVLVSHDTPAGYIIPGIDNAPVPSFITVAALAQANNHRDRLREIVDAVQPSTIIHGHYHHWYAKTVDLGYGPIDIIGLDCDGTSPTLNTHSISLDQFYTANGTPRTRSQYIGGPA